MRDPAKHARSELVAGASVANKSTQSANSAVGALVLRAVEAMAGPVQYQALGPRATCEHKRLVIHPPTPAEAIFYIEREQ